MVALLANQVGFEKRGGCMSPTLIRWGGVAAMLGGLLWRVAAIITASKPRGCIGSAEWDVLAMRDTSDVAPLLLLALLLSAMGLAGMFIRARNTGRLDRWGQIGVALCAAGVALLVLGMGLNAISEVFWALVPLGGLALVIGLALAGIAALGGGAACHRLVGDAWVQRPERPGVDGYTVRDRVASGRVCPVVGLGGYASATLACSLSFREARLSETGLPRITALGSWVDTVVAYVSESPRQGTKKEAGLDFWIMCRRGCQPGRMIMCHPYY